MRPIGAKYGGAGTQGPRHTVSWQAHDDVVFERIPADIPPDRTTTIGKMIDAYLKGDQEAEDHVIHLLFSANRWEAA
jgi:thymidylate kinase